MFLNKRVSWALRKLKFPINGNAIVLDVGSGGNPYPRSDVLLDRLGGAEHRSGVAMKIDRLAIMGDATKLPFKDKSFDFVIASHILEHMPNPDIFLSELQRVGKAGYIETPNFLCERLMPSNAHCLEVALVDDVLTINKKKSQSVDAFFESLEFLRSDRERRHVFRADPSLFHVKYFWVDEIKWRIINPDVSCEWIEDIYARSTSKEVVVSDPGGARTGWRKFGMNILGAYHRMKRLKRMKNFDIDSVLACPDCGGDLVKDADEVRCGACNARYSRSPYLDFEHRLA